MDMETKNKMVVEYINDLCKVFEDNGNPVSNEKISEITNKYMDSPLSFEEIKAELDKLVEERMQELSTLLNYNYHTHTYRSGHSEYASDEEMIQAAKESGITMIGFSEHIPNPDLLLPDEDHRMLLSEVDGYVESINKIKQDNPDMTILSGFEAEFDPMKESFLGEMREKVDYMILGQHFVNDGLQMVQARNNPNYPLAYADMVCKGIDSGIFDIVAHPDHFMEYRDTIEKEEDKKLFDENAKTASKMICEKARDMGIPLELNLSPASNNPIMSDGNYAYPHPLFWKIAKETVGLAVLYGVDAHSLGAFKVAGVAIQRIGDIKELVEDKLVPGDYNPVVARQNNTKLQEAYKKGQSNALTFETHMVGQIVNGVLGKTENGLDSESIAVKVGSSLNGVMQRCVAAADKKDKAIVEKISTVTDSQDISLRDKKGIIDRKKQALNDTNQILANQQRVIENAKNNVINAMNMGCETKKEYSSIVTHLTENQSTKNGEHKVRTEEQINRFKQVKSEVKAPTYDMTQPKVLKKTYNNPNNNNSSSGFVHNIILALIITFAIGVAVGIGYMLYKI